MQTQSDPILLHSKLSSFLLFLVVSLLLFSCSKDQYSVINLETNVKNVVQLPFVEANEELQLSFSLLGENGTIQVKIAAPNAVSAWYTTVQAENKNNDGSYTVGPLAMGNQILLPRGQWELTVINQDGLSLSEEFTLSESSESKKITAYPAVFNNQLVNVPIGATLYCYDQDGELLSSQKVENQSIDPAKDTKSVMIEIDNNQYLLNL